jgi:antitoxin component YwqK of YwqJK toxin-antitoxin module
MKKSSYIILLFILIATAMAANLGYKLFTKPNEEPTLGIFIKNGLIYMDRTDKPFTGTVVSRVAGNTLEYDVVNGIKNGRFNVYKNRDKYILSGTVRNNQNTGEWIYYYPDGKIESKGEFVKDQLNGKWCWYYNDGSIKQEGSFVNGERDGTWIMYNEDGIIQSQVTFQNGKTVNIIRTEKQISI